MSFGQGIMPFLWDRAGMTSTGGTLRTQRQPWGAAQATASTGDDCRMGHIMRMRACMSVLPSTVNGMELGLQEWRDSLFLRYLIVPPT